MVRKIRAAPSEAEGRHSLKGCLYVHVCAWWYVCDTYWYVYVLCLLVHMCAVLIGTNVCTHDFYGNLYTCVLRMCAILIGTHVCYACWHTCVV